MGLVYEAWDDRLDRTVAVKVIRAATTDESSRERFRREARAAGAINHPNICHIYEIGEDQGELFIAMERLEGEPLAERLQRGPLPPPEAVQTALGALSALEAVHARGLLHRDLKPSNVFLTPHGVKLLDFGLALPVATAPSIDQTGPVLTLPGVVLGTPGYMAPEQILGQTVDARTDLYAVGAMLFEMLSGRPPFAAATAGDVLARVLTERPPALHGSALVTAADRVIHRAMARNPEDRYPDASSIARDLRETLRFVESGAFTPALAVRRLIVLPFRLLRPDPEIEFLSFGLADAIGTSLSGTDALAVRSSLAASRYAGAPPDLPTLAAEADVDLVVNGTILRAGGKIRVTAQLLEVPRGTLLWSHTLQVTLDDLFQVQDDIARHVYESVHASLGGRRPSERVPRGRAHELYLRGNQLAFNPQGWQQAKELYEQAVAEDPEYAAAWARLGRIYRILAKYGSGGDAEGYLRADRALKRALELDPDLSMALTYYAQLELEMGRPREALVRLLERAARHPSDAYLLAGLVHVCRYCGLVNVSIAAHEHVRRLDPVMLTGVWNSLWLAGDYERALQEVQVGTEMAAGIVLASLGRIDEAIHLFEDDERRFAGTLEADFARVMRMTLQDKADETREAVTRILAAPTFTDPEALFHSGRVLARIGDADAAVQSLTRALDGGYCGLPMLLLDSWLDPLRARSDFRGLLDRAAAQKRAAANAYVIAGGERILGVPAD